MGKKKWRRKYERLLEQYRWLEACQNAPVDVGKPTPGALKPFAGGWVAGDEWMPARTIATNTSEWHEETWR